LLKIDKLDNSPISDEILEELVKKVKQTSANAIVFSDFRHGIFNRMSVKTLTQAIPKGAYRVADSQVAGRWGNITEFNNFDLITPNEREARFALGDQDSTLGSLAGNLHKSADFKSLILKLGNRGIFCLNKNSDVKEPHFSVDSFARKIVDAVGAGDALLAYATLSMLATGSLVIAGILGSMAAACECECDGNIPISPENLLNKINEVEEMTLYKTSDKL
jgi:bifunctional ADP-heptose synthase (sugar kinase/adenylyltransferase)